MLELVNTPMEELAPAISPVILILVSVLFLAVTEPYCCPSICW